MKRHSLPSASLLLAAYAYIACSLAANTWRGAEIRTMESLAPPGHREAYVDLYTIMRAYFVRSMRTSKF